MAITKSQKTDILENLKENIKNAKSVSFTVNNGLTVKEITILRKELRTVNSTIALAKKTLIKIAFKEVFNVEIDDSILPGQIAIICSNDDAVSALGKVNEFIKGYKKDPKMVWAGSFFEGAVKDAAETALIASIPSREVLLGRLVGSMMSPLSALARFFDAAAKKLTDEGKDNLGSSAPAVKVEAPKEEAKVEEVTTPVVEETKVDEVTTPVVEETKVDEVTTPVVEETAVPETTEEKTEEVEA